MPCRRTKQPLSSACHFPLFPVPAAALPCKNLKGACHHVRQTPVFGLIRRFIPYYRPYKRILFTSLTCAMLTSASGLIFPLIVREITDRAISDIGSLTAGFILQVGLFFLLLQLMDAGCRYYMQYAATSWAP